MKRVVAVLNPRGSRPSHGAKVLMCAAATYLAMYGVFYVQTQRRGLSQEEQERKIAASSSEQAEAPAKELLLVSSIIKASMPNNPDTAQLAHLIVTESRNAGVDPLFVTAVVKAESMFKSRAISNKGARGLMQLMPKTGQYISAIADNARSEKIDLHDPATNLRLGIAYLKYLEQRFAGNKHQALIAYNWGPTNLTKALKTKRSLPEQSLQYAHKVLSHHDQWKTSLDMPATSDVTAIG
jgi:soluble lytic murein transglycosylase-like protein